MAKAAAQVKHVKVPADIEYKVIGNAFGLMIATGGLLAGSMVSERSLEYWRDDIMPLALLAIMGFLLFRSFMTTMTVYQQVPQPPPRPAQSAPPRETVQPDQTVVAQLPGTPPGYTPDQVVEEVVKRIEAQKAEQIKKHKPKD